MESTELSTVLTRSKDRDDQVRGVLRASRASFGSHLGILQEKKEGVKQEPGIDLALHPEKCIREFQASTIASECVPSLIVLIVRRPRCSLRRLA